MILERAIVVQKIDDYHYKVRIPSLNKSGSAVGSTPDAELYTATVVSPPGLVPAYQQGNAVFVSFENTDSSSPVIVGALLNDNAAKIQSDIFTTSLTVSTNVKLPAETQIGDVTAENISVLVGQTVRVNSEFERVDNTLSSISSNIRGIDNKIIYMEEHSKEVDANAVKLANRVSSTEATLLQTRESLIKHVEGEIRHVTGGDKENWNTAFKHSSNSNVHVTSAQKEAWTNHKNDTTSHITTNERKDWNSKAAANHTHTAFSSMVLTDGVTYGKTLPTSPSKGQLFFLLESD